MHTPASREASMRGAAQTTFEKLARNGHTLTPEQEQETQSRLAGEWDRIRASPVDDVTAAVQVSTAIGLVVGEVLGLVPAGGVLAWQLRVMAMGYEAQHHHFMNGGYPTPSPQQLGALVRTVRLGAEQLAPFGDALSDDEARVLMAEHVARAMIEVLGAPSARTQAN